jgi:hypothetical protein
MDKNTLLTIRRKIIKNSIWSVIFLISFYYSSNHFTTICLFVFFFIQLASLIGNIVEYYSNKRLQELRNNKQYQYNKEYYQKFIKDMFNDMENKYKYHYQQQILTPRTRDNLAEAYQLFKLKPECTIEDIKKTYRKFATIWHPDKWSIDTVENQEISKRNFQKLNAAYEVFKKHRNFN